LNPLVSIQSIHCRESIASSEAIRRIVTVHVTEAGSATIAPIVAATALCVRSGRAMCEPV
jgi:hypothetical protein